MAKRNPYEVLGVSPNADKEEIDKAFRKKARRAHPDAGGDDKEFKELNECHALLISDEKRDKFDRDGEREDGPEMPPMSLAMQVLSSTLNMVIQAAVKEGKDIEKIDIVLLMKKTIANRLKEMKEEIAEFQKAKAGFLKAKKRFKRKKKAKDEQEDIMMQNFVEFHIEKIERTIKIATGTFNGSKDALKLLDQYIYERDMEPERPRTFTSFSDAFTSHFGGSPFLRPGSWRGTPQDGSLNKNDEEDG